jgi:arginine/lysine/ornithine decarboxylase
VLTRCTDRLVAAARRLTNCTFDGIVYNVQRVMEECLAIKPDLVFLWDEAWWGFAYFHYLLRVRAPPQPLPPATVTELTHACVCVCDDVCYVCRVSRALCACS